MRARTGGALWLVVLIAGGCTGGPAPGLPTGTLPAAAPGSGQTASGSEGGKWAWKGFARLDAPRPAPLWDWLTAVPQGATRAELVVPAVPRSQLAALLPEWQEQGVRRAAAGGVLPITAVNREPVANYDQLHAAVMRTVDAGKPVPVALGGAGAALEPTRLVALSQAAVPEDGLLRVPEDGNPWVLVRRDGVRCKVLARVERERRLLHVAMSLGVCWGPQVMLPREVRAACDGVPLRCLSVAATLEALYDNGRTLEGGGDASDSSFAAVSERPDYRLPENYRRLQQATAGADRPPQRPALATLPGLNYPGPAVLGDARALSAFLQQRQLVQPGEPERVGWIIFGGAALRSGNTIALDVDLGAGPVRLNFSVPGP